MTTAETVRRLLVDAAGDALCNSCLAFACSVSLTEMRQVTEELLRGVGFSLAERCGGCRHPAPAIAYTAKCAYCRDVIPPGDDALQIERDLFHAACFRQLSSKKTIRIARRLTEESRRLIEDSRRRIEQRNRAASSG